MILNFIYSQFVHITLQGKRDPTGNALAVQSHNARTQCAYIGLLIIVPLHLQYKLSNKFSLGDRNMGALRAGPWSS
jgi:hypothetical protein